MMKNRKMTWSTYSIVKVFYIGKKCKELYIEKVVYRLSRLCHISADVTVNVTLFGAINIIITSGGS